MIVHEATRPSNPCDLNQVGIIIKIEIDHVQKGREHIFWTLKTTGKFQDQGSGDERPAVKLYGTTSFMAVWLARSEDPSKGDQIHRPVLDEPACCHSPVFAVFPLIEDTPKPGTTDKEHLLYECDTRHSAYLTHLTKLPIGL